MVFDPTKELKDDQAHALIKDIITRGGRIIIGSHVKQRMSARGYLMQDVEYILVHGTIVKKEYREDCKHWRYTIQGVDLDGSDGSVVTAISSFNGLVLITVLS